MRILHSIEQITDNQIEAILKIADHPFEKWNSTRQTLEQRNSHDIRGIDTEVLYYTFSELLPFLIGPYIASLFNPLKYWADGAGREIFLALLEKELENLVPSPSYQGMDHSDWQDVVDLIGLLHGNKVEIMNWKAVADEISQRL